MYKSPSKLPEKARSAIAEALNARLGDGLDLHGQIKVPTGTSRARSFRRCIRCSRRSR
jgi:hypothetical protein